MNPGWAIGAINSKGPLERASGIRFPRQLGAVSRGFDGISPSKRTNGPRSVNQLAPPFDVSLVGHALGPCARSPAAGQGHLDAAGATLMESHVAIAVHPMAASTSTTSPTCWTSARRVRKGVGEGLQHGSLDSRSQTWHF
jgi:hypothetical protein